MYGYVQMIDSNSNAKYEEKIINIIKEALLFSGTDGIITVFNLIVGLTAAEIQRQTIFLVILIAIIGDALSMALSFYNSNIEKLTDTTLLYIGCVANFWAFVILGGMVISFFMLFQHNSIMNAIISIIPSLLLLSLLQTEYTNRISTFVIGLSGSLFIYGIGRFSKNYIRV